MRQWGRKRNRVYWDLRDPYVRMFYNMVKAAQAFREMNKAFCNVAPAVEKLQETMLMRIKRKGLEFLRGMV